MTQQTDIVDLIKQRRTELERVKKELKSEFFGLDAIIDRVINSVSTWYLLPQAINYPVIINLWGLTGVGKTQLVRSLVKKLNFQHKFVEVQMDAFSSGSGYYQDSICSILQSSAIEEGETGILLLDEFQRFRTVQVEESGETKELDVKRFQDVWMLLSDGKFSADYSLYSKIERELTQSMYDEDWKKNNDESSNEATSDGSLSPSSESATTAIPDVESVSGSSSLTTTAKSRKKKKKVVIRKYKLSPWEAIDYKRLLKLKEPVAEIMTWDLQKINYLCHEALKNRTSSEIDYSKLLIFICGNLDEAFKMAGNLQDCDTDADVFHDITKKISIIEVKGALIERFRREQISRLGNNHIIYPSLSKRSYELIIENTSNKYAQRLYDNIGVSFTLSQSVFDEIYQNSVFPTQGTRPVFSSIHQILSSPLVNLSIWAVENDVNHVTVSIDGAKSILIGKIEKDGQILKYSDPINLDIRLQRSMNTVDFNTMVAVHEAGHAIVYAVLHKVAPAEVKINLASFKGGFTKIDEDDVTSRDILTKRIAVNMGGRAAEEIIFGPNHASTGAWRDIDSATAMAGRFHKLLGFGDTSSQIRNIDSAEWAPSNYKDYDKRIESLVNEQKQVAIDIIKKNPRLLKVIVNKLLENKTIRSEEFVEFAKKYIPGITVDVATITPPYRDLWEKYDAAV